MYKEGGGGGSYQFSSVEDGIYTLREAQRSTTPSLRRFPKVLNCSFETVPVFI